MELEDITDCADVEQLIEQYLEVALTSENAVQISPQPERFVCTTVFPRKAHKTARMTQFVRDYRVAVTDRWDRVIKFQQMVEMANSNPTLLWHPLSTQLVTRVGHGFACVDVAQKHTVQITKHMKRHGAFFDGSPQADPLPVGKTENTVTPFVTEKKSTTE